MCTVRCNIANRVAQRTDAYLETAIAQIITAETLPASVTEKTQSFSRLCQAVRERPMPQPNRRDPSPLAPIARRRCPSCGLQLFLSCIEPTDNDDYEARTYECSVCAYGETVRAKFR